MAAGGPAGRPGAGTVRRSRRRRVRGRAAGGQRARRAPEPLRRLVSAEPVLTPEMLAVARAVADRYAGTWPTSCGWRCRRATRRPRGAGTAQRGTEQGEPARHRVRRRTSPVWPGPDYPAVCRAGPACRGSPPGRRHGRSGRRSPGRLGRRGGHGCRCDAAGAGGGQWSCCPTGADVDTVEAAVAALAGTGHHVRLDGRPGAGRALPGLPGLSAGPGAGRRRHPRGGLRAGGRPRPGRALGRRRRPARRAAGPLPPQPRRAGAACRAGGGPPTCVGGWSVSVESAALLADGWARTVEVGRQDRRVSWPRVEVADDKTRPRRRRRGPRPDPGRAWRAVQQGLTRGPVLVQVPRAGYLPALACQTCRRAGRCPACAGPLRLAAAERAARSARPAAGAPDRCRSGPARTAVDGCCAPCRWGCTARRRNWAGPSRTPRSSCPAPSGACRGWGPQRPSCSRLPGSSRSPRPATPSPSCSTAT